MNYHTNAKAWSHDSIKRYYDKNRVSTKDVYTSEWVFLKDKLKNGIKVLDIGCAKGFMANVLQENVENFTYVGIDISKEMITNAKEKFPQHTFFHVSEGDYSLLNNEQFDLVICLGILHLHDTWRNTLLNAWQHTKSSLIFDLRETHEASIEDKSISKFKMNFDGNDVAADVPSLPYNIINTTEAKKTIFSLCDNFSKMAHYGYVHPVSELAVTPINKVIVNVYCIEKGNIS